MDQVARVAVSAATYAIDKPYDYRVPQALLGKAQVGMRVTVPFGRGNRTSEGLILALVEDSPRPELKALSSLLDQEPVLGGEEIKLALWLRERYFCTLYDGVKALLPAGLWYRIQEVYTLAVDREKFSAGVTAALRSHPLCTVVEGEVTALPEGPTIIATGPLTSDAFAQAIVALTGQEGLSFYDAAAPIVTLESVDMDRAFRASRYGRGEDDYINCPMTEEEYNAFYDALIAAETAPVHGFEPDGLRVI